MRRISAFIALILALPVAAESWTRFRGPNGTGIGDAPTVPASFTGKDFNWKITLPGGGHSSPVIWKDRIFVTCSDEQSATRTVLCVAAADGKTLWKREFPSHPYRQTPDNDYASSTPAVDEKHVYVCWSTPEDYTLICLDHDGKDVWKYDIGRYTSQHGSGTSPIVVGDVVLLGNDQEGPHSSLLGIDRNTGKKLWERDRTTGRTGGMSASTPVVFKSPDGSEQAVFTSRYEGITGIDPKTGNVVWQAKDVFRYRTVGSPLIVGDKVLGFSGEGVRGHEFLVVKPNGPGTEVAYQLHDSTPYVPTPICVDDLLFTLGDVGVVTCYRASTGQQLWQQKIGTAYYSSPVSTNGRIFCVSKKGQVTCFAAADHFQKLGESDLGDKCFATPAIADGRMYFRTYTHLISIGKGSAGQTASR
jgi:outer membrane protein assembly factor BamB